MGKVGEIKQLKYEMCRPKKKGKTVLKKGTVEEKDHKEEKQDIPAYAIPKPRVQNYALPRDHSQPLPLPQETNSELYSVPYEDEAAVQQLNSLTFNNPRPITQNRVPETEVPDTPEATGIPGDVQAKEASAPKAATTPTPRRTLPPPRRLPTPHRKAPPPPSAPAPPPPSTNESQTTSP